MRHFFTRGEQREQVAMCPQGPNRVSLFMSEHTIHSSSDSMLLFRDGLRVPTCPLDQSEENSVCVCVRESRTDCKRETGRKQRQGEQGGKHASLHPSWKTFYGVIDLFRYCLLGGYDLIYFLHKKDNAQSSFFRLNIEGLTY